jgi:hypothetical protein
MMRRIHDYNHRSKLHELPEGDKAVDKSTHGRHALTAFLFFYL